MPKRRRGRSRPQLEFRNSRLRDVVRWLVAAKILGVILVLDPTALQSFDLPKTVFSLATAWLLAAALALAMWRYGFSIVPRSPLHVTVAALAAVWVLSTVFSADPYLALFGDPSRYQGLTYLVDMLVLYVAVAVAFSEPRDFVAPGVALLVASAVVLLYAFIQRIGQDPVSWGVDPTLRPFSVFGNPDMLGHFLSTLVGLAGGVALFASGKHARTVRVIAIATGMLAMVAVGVVATRGTLVGIAAAFAVAPVAIVRVRGAQRRTVQQVATGAIVLAVAGIVLVLISPLGERVRTTLAGAQIRDRVLIYEAALQATRDRPILGWGPNSFAVAYPRYRNPDPAAGKEGNQPESSAHSWLFEAAATTGVLGVLCTLAVVLLGIERLFRIGLKREPMIAGALLLGVAGYWAHGLLSVGSISVDWFGWAALGATVGITTERQIWREARRFELVPAVAMGVIAVVLAAAGWSSLDASHLAATANRAIQAKRVDPAVLAATAATRVDSGRAQYWELLGLAYDLGQKWRDAGDAFTEAARRAPYIATHHSNLARARARQTLAGDQTSGGSAAALDAARRAVTVDPNNWESQSVLAEVQSAFGEYERALETLAVAVSLKPNNPNNDVVAAEAAAKVQNPVRARALLERILNMKETAVLRLAFANVALRLGDRVLALSNAQRALQLEPGNADALKVVASLGG